MNSSPESPLPSDADTPRDEDLPIAPDEEVETDPAASPEDFHPEDPDVEAIVDEEA